MNRVILPTVSYHYKQKIQPFFFLNIYFGVCVYVCVCVHVKIQVWLDVREQLYGLRSLFLPLCGSGESNLDHKVVQQTPLPTEPPWQLYCGFYKDTDAILSMKAHTHD